MTTLSVAIVAHQKRTTQANALAELLDAPIAMDDGTHGAGRNHDRALHLAMDTQADWAIIIEDDAQPVEDFYTHAAAALSTAPTPIASLYTGRSRPPQYQARIQQVLTQDPHWILAPTLMHAVCVAIRQDIVNDLLAVMNRVISLDADQRIGAAGRRIGINRVAHSNPSLVEHTDLPTLIQHRDGKPRNQPRVAWNLGTRDTWTNHAVRI